MARVATVLALLLCAAAATHALPQPPALSRELLQSRTRASRVRSPPPPAPPPPPYFQPLYYGKDQKVPPIEQVLNSPADCSGFMQPRVYMESQAWFTPDTFPSMPLGDAVNARSSHLHVGACMPHRQWMAGFLALNVLVQKHNFNTDADVELTAEFIWDNNNRNVTIKIQDAGPVTTGWVCKNATDYSVLCMQVYQVMLPTQTAEYKVPDGLTEVKLVASSRIRDGVNTRSMQARMSSWVVINNAGNVPFPRGLGKVLSMKQIAVMGFPWAYTHADFKNDIPLAPLTGTWSFNVSNFIKTNTANTTGVFISIDPAFHKDPVVLGMPLVNLPTMEQLPASNCPVEKGHVDCSWQLSFDTTQLDDTKWHKLFIRTDSFVANNDPMLVAFNSNQTAKRQIGGGTFSAVTLIMFRTNNTGAAPTDPAPAIDDGTSITDPTTPPIVFSPPPGVTVFDGSQPLPSPNNTLYARDNGYRCAGWLEPRVYIEGQTWHTQPSAAVDAASSAQLLLGGCMPHGQKVAGKVPFDLLVQKRFFPPGSSSTVKVEVTFTWASGNITFELSQRNKAGKMIESWSCDASGNDCRTLVSSWVDTKPASRQYVFPDGLITVLLEASTSVFDGASTREFRVRATSWMVVANTQDTDTAGARQRIADRSRTKFPFGDNFASLETALPSAPLASPWALATRHAVDTRNADVSLAFVGAAATPATVPGGPSQLVLLNASAASLPTANCPVSRKMRPICNMPSLVLDTSALCSGPYLVSLRTDAFVSPTAPVVVAFNSKMPPSGQVGAGTFSAGLAFGVEVANPAQPASCQVPVMAASARGSGPTSQVRDVSQLSEAVLVSYTA